MGGVTWKQTAAYQRWASWTRPALCEGLCACDWSHSLLVPSHSLMWWHREKAYERCCSWLNYSLCDVLSNQPPANSVWEWECVTANLVSTEITWLSEAGTEMYVTLPPSKAPISSLKAAARMAADPPQWSGPMWWHQRPTGIVSVPHRVPLMVPNNYNAKWRIFLCDRPQLFSQSSHFTICAIAFILAALFFRKPWDGNLVSNTTECMWCYQRAIFTQTVIKTRMFWELNQPNCDIAKEKSLWTGQSHIGTRLNFFVFMQLPGNWRQT